MPAFRFVPGSFASRNVFKVPRAASRTVESYSVVWISHVLFALLTDTGHLPLWLL